MDYRSHQPRKRSQDSRAEEDGRDEIVDISDEDFWSPVKKTVEAEETGTELSELGDLPEDTELVVTSVTLLKRPKFRYRISFGPYSLEVHEDVMIKYRMMKGAVFTRRELEEIVAADERQGAYADALLYLSRKPRTLFEIIARLGEKGWGEETIHAIIERLTSEGLVNDAAYALEWAAQRVKNRGKGKMRVRYELRQKGVSKPLIEEALGEVSEDDEFDSAMGLAVKKWQSTSGEPMDKKRKTGAFLQRRGFSGKIVSRVLRELSRKDGNEDMEDWEEE